MYATWSSEAAWSHVSEYANVKALTEVISCTSAPKTYDELLPCKQLMWADCLALSDTL